MLAPVTLLLAVIIPSCPLEILTEWEVAGEHNSLRAP